MKHKKLLFVLLGAGVFVMAGFGANNVNVTVRRAPYVVPSVSTRSERGSAPCKYCNSSIRYDRKYKWDVDAHEWVETTDPASIPEVCRTCRQKEKDQEKLNKEERRLDRDIEYQQTKGRIDKKRSTLRRLRKANR